MTDDPRWEDLQWTEADPLSTDDDFQMLIEADDEAQTPTYWIALRTLHLVAGPLTPEAVVQQFARPADSPLHGAFHWGSDDDVTDQAASMLQSWSDLLTR